MALLISVTGSTPGVGKSTLCAALCEAYTAAGFRVDGFREEEILTRPAFAAVAAEFTATGVVELATLTEATVAYARDLDGVAVTDALVPYIPSLLAWGHTETEIAGFMARLAGLLAPLRTVIVHLDGDPATALPRAAAREGEGWMDWFVAKLGSYRAGPPVSDADGAVARLERERAVTLRLLESGPWETVVIDRAGERPPEEVAALALAGIGSQVDGGKPAGGPW